MKYKAILGRSLAVLVLVFSFVAVLGGRASAGFTGYDFEASSTLAGALSNYTITYVPDTDVPAAGLIFLGDFPDDFKIPGSATYAVSVDGDVKTIDSTNNLSNGDSISLSIDEDVTAGSEVEVVITGARNPHNTGAYTLQALYTTDGVATIDVALTPAALTVTYPAPVAFAGGNGSGGSPYIIETCAQLQSMRSDLDASYVLGQNVDCTATSGWNEGRGFDPIGYTGNAFAGELDGQGFTIDQLTIIRADNNQAFNHWDDEYEVGLFGAAENATIVDVRLTNTKVQGYSNVGGVVGYAGTSVLDGVYFNRTTIDNNCNPGDCVWARYGSYGGGLVGQMNGGTITSSHAGGPVKGSGVVIGGLVGWLVGGQVEYSTSWSNIDGGQDIGGAIGRMDAGSVVGVSASGSVLANTDEDIKQGVRAGGLIGGMNGGDVEQSSASGNVTAERDMAGGLVGHMNTGASVEDAYATGDVEANYVVGGLVGEMGDGTRIDRSYATGSATANAESAGGLVGFIQDSGNVVQINDSFATGAVIVDPFGFQGGLFGRFAGTDPSSVINDSYYDGPGTGQAHCGVDGFGDWDDTDCVNIDGDADPDYFFDDSNEPFTQSSTPVWDPDVWYFSGEHYPILATTPPTILCEEPGATSTSVTVNCDIYPDTGFWGLDTWQMQYKKASQPDSAYKSVSLADDHAASATINGLAPNTEYRVRFRYMNSYESPSDWAHVDATTLAGNAQTDSDEDGAPNTVEDAAPNNGDANNDGTPDSEQSNVVSFASSVTGKYVTLELDDECTLLDALMQSEDSLAKQDGDYSYPNGLMHFEADCGANGFTANVKAYYHDVSSAGFTLRKFNDRTDTFGGISAAVSETTIGGKTVTLAAYSVTDGGELDQDGQANGTIVDPAGLATSASLENSGQPINPVMILTAVGITFSTIYLGTRKFTAKI